KIRSARVELGEVEAHLRTLGDFRDILVVPYSPSLGETELACYFVRAPGQSVDKQGLRAALAHRVPQYMVPAYFVELSSIPLTANGKPDRKALPLPVAPSGLQSAEPANPTEAAIAAIWADLLGTGEVGADSDFFVLGGHSLLAMRALAPLSELAGRQVRVAEIIGAPTPRRLARAIAKGESAERVAVRYLNCRTPTAPLFLIMPTILGSTDFFARLAAGLPPEFECAVWNPPQDDGAAQPLGIREAGALCAREVADIARHRDVVLFGWSFGGLVAMETFRSLRHDRLALIVADSFVSARPGETPERDSAAVFNAMLAQEGLDPVGLPAQSLLERFRSNFAASRAYAAEAVNDDRPVFELRAKIRESGSEDLLRLADAAGLRAQVVEVEGDHYFINDVRGAGAVATVALAALDALQSRA
ncbi:MAG TPA: thioesterase domain-containing protein, partial [Allosphingosinicella sp.]